MKAQEMSRRESARLREVIRSKFQMDGIDSVDEDSTIGNIIDISDSPATACFDGTEVQTSVVGQNVFLNTTEIGVDENSNRAASLPVHSPRVASEGQASMVQMKTYWCGIGRVQKVRTYKINSSHPTESEVLYCETNFLPSKYAAWIRAGYSKKKRPRNIGGLRTFDLAPICIVPETAAIFEACMSGNLKQVIDLVKMKKASVHDTTVDGLTLLHVAGAYIRPEVCEWLIDNGIRTDAIDIRNGSGWGNGMIDEVWYRLLRPEKNWTRPVDAVQTIRLLVGKGKCDPMTTTSSTLKRIGKLDFFKTDQTPLHDFSGPAEAFQYLLQQDQFSIDLETRNGEGLTVVDAHIRNGIPERAAAARLLVKHWRPSTTVVDTQTNPITPVGTAVAKFMSTRQLKRQLAEEDFLPWGHEGAKLEQICEASILEASSLGTNIHALDIGGRTPFSELTMYSGSIQNEIYDDLPKRLMVWFKILVEAGHELQDYIRAERKALLDYHSASWRKDKECCKHLITACPTYSWALCRSMMIEMNAMTGEMIIHIKEEFSIPAKVKNLAIRCWGRELG
ncbi:uncharacterized protein LY89DRAFT_772947 [Mollisia scopiformis]|uniref:Uncharacterized protein n=1 Tax=Mollisia scopiformis TaxID=149040 RepID=A0A194XIR8_MOLSC|nr:uncharacterized protein LY89DRAFT_772947 [Mollisia scopiformis]KUJ20130.1 hypothetical protein LY89DRAFT_772947 [Mollisia scopiformis]